MNRILKFTVSLIFAGISILVFGWLFGRLINILIPYEQSILAQANNIYPYTVNQLLIPIYYLLPIYFMPYFILLYYLLAFSKERKYILLWRILIVLSSYFIYGYFVYGPQFWHLKILFGAYPCLAIS